jgi:hypothetical protein
MSKEQPRLASLRAKLKARDKVPGFEKNCEAIRAEIQRLETCSDLDL